MSTYNPRSCILTCSSSCICRYPGGLFLTYSLFGARFHCDRASLRHCMQPSTLPKATVLLLSFLLCVQRSRSFALYPAKTTQTPYGKRTDQHYTSAPSAPRQAPKAQLRASTSVAAAPWHYSGNAHRSTAYPRPVGLPFVRTSLLDRTPSLCAVADATVMASEADMPVLRVLRVDEVPTLKADPVDPIAREQAKVRCLVLRSRASDKVPQ